MFRVERLLPDGLSDPCTKVGSAPPIAVLKGRVEVNGVLGVELDFLSPHPESQRSLDQIQQFYAGMLMQPNFLHYDLVGTSAMNAINFRSDVL